MKKENSDLTLKIFSVIIAVILWSYVTKYEINPERTKEHRNIPVTYVNQASLEKDGLIIMNPEELTVNVKVVGRKSEIDNHSREMIKAEIDLSGYKEGQVKVPIDVKLVQSSGVRLLGYEPERVLITFEKIISQEKPLKVQTIGKLKPNYALGDIQIKNQSILVKGPRSLVNKVEEAIAIVDVSQQKEEVRAPIKLLDDEGNDVIGVEKEPTVVDVTVPIFKVKELPIELQLENQPPENYEITNISIKPSKIKLKGKDDIDSLTFIQTKLINIDYLNKNEDVPVELELPEGIELLDPNQKITVSLNIEEVVSKTFQYDLDEIEIRNLTEGLTIEEIENKPQIGVVITGSKDKIDKLNKGDIIPYLDLKNIEEGAHNIEIGLTKPSEVLIKEITPKFIELKINNN